MSAPATAPATEHSTATRVGAAAILLPLLLVAMAGTLRFYRLGHPPRIYFDEVYYANDAKEVLDHGVEKGFAVHPPVGKWVIAGGIALFGDDSFGWRFGVAVAGTLTVLATYLLGLRLFRRRGVAALAAFLLAIDGLAFTMSRIAMLDMILSLFVVTGAWLLLVDRDRMWADLPEGPVEPGQAPPHRPRTYRWLAGVVFGLALATKWSGLLAIGAAGLFLIGNELLWRRRTTGRPLHRWWRAAASIGASLVVVPLLVYVASYGSWFANFEQTRQGQEQCADGCTLALPDIAGTWADEQLQIYRFHRDLTAEHPYRASPATWPLMLRPVAYYYESCDGEKLANDECVVEPGNVAEVLGMGNPAIWWLALGAYAVVGWYAAARRDWRAGLLLVFLLGQFLPWLATSRPAFLFYTVPMLPFMTLALAYAAWRSREEPALRWVPFAILALAVAGFLFWYPVLAGTEMSKEAWQLRIWTSRWV